jgi:glyoxylate reductase
MPYPIYVTRRIPEAGLECLRSSGADVEVSPDDRDLTRDELLGAVRGRDALLTMLADRIDEALLDAAGPQCRCVANYAVGYDNIDVPAATRRSVIVTHTPGVLTETSADTAWALLMSVARRVVEADRFVRSGQWDGWGPLQYLGHDVHGATLGIVGAGRIGSAMARRGFGFGMTVLYVSRSDKPELDKLGARRVELDELLSASDFVALHVPLTDATRHLIGAAQIARMKPSAYLINAARGPVVNEAALVDALRAGRIAGAGFDVYEHEPQLTPGLAALDNVVLLPHLGSATTATRTRMAMLAAGSIVEVLAGRVPANALNPEARRNDE